jgi:hypothetical protein
MARLALLLCAAVSMFGLTACFKKKPFHTTADTEGVYVQAAGASYQVQLSRELNPFATEDAGYLRGLPPLTAKPSGKEEWFAIWLRAENLGRKPIQMLPLDQYALEDTQGNVYKPVPLTDANPLRYNPISIPAHTTVPLPDSAASFSPTQGEEMLFKINVNAYQNRPLTLHLLGPGSPGPTLADVSIDL